MGLITPKAVAILFLLSIPLQSVVGRDGKVDKPRSKTELVKQCFKTVSGLTAVAIVSGGLLAKTAHEKLHETRTYEFRSQAPEANNLDLVILGDSLATNFRSGSGFSLISQFAAGIENGGAFVDTDPSLHSVNSLSEILSWECHVRTTCLASPGAKLSSLDDWMSWQWKVLGLHHIADQIDRIPTNSSNGRLIILWAGQNDLAFEHQYQKKYGESWRYSIIQHLSGPVKYDAMNVSRHLVAIQEKTSLSSGKTAVVVFGLSDPSSVVAQFSLAKKDHENNPSRFPFLPRLAAYFENLNDQNASKYIAEVQQYNQSIRSSVDAMNSALESRANMSLRFFYSDALSQPFDPDLSLVNSEDGLHPSIDGKSQIAKSAAKGVSPAMKFLNSENRSLAKD